MTKGNGKPIPRVEISKSISETELDKLKSILKDRFENNQNRHTDISWNEVESKLNKSKLESIYKMEETGGEPDVVIINNKISFVDCSPETPNRKSICYDKEAEAIRNKKGVYPGGNAIDLAKKMGVEVLDEDQYRQLQEIGEFDLKSSSWLKTPEPVRKLGGAIFGDRRFDRVFIYHNGADSFYSGRGFRGILEL